MIREIKIDRQFSESGYDITLLSAETCEHPVQNLDAD